jgi:hypothetical protein
MAIKRLCQVGLLCLSLFIPFSSFAININNIGQVIQISTHLKSIVGKPSWILILRDIYSGRIFTYEYDFVDTRNDWLALTFNGPYRVTLSRLEYYPFAEIDNFCNLESGEINGESMFVRLTGTLTPDERTSNCTVLRYKNATFPIVNGEDN